MSTLKKGVANSQLARASQISMSVVIRRIMETIIEVLMSRKDSSVVT